MNKMWKDKWAVVTGASSGIGEALATQLAAGGTHLVLTARRVNRLEQLAYRLGNVHGIRTEVFAADLALPDAPEKIYPSLGKKGW